MRTLLLIVLVLVVAGGIAGAYLLRGDTAALPQAADSGADPALPAPVKRLVPTVKVADAKGWPYGAAPHAQQGLAVTKFADGLAHPRWLLALPNGDILVAETDAPPKPGDGNSLKGMVMKFMMQRAGSSKGSANRITLLRDTNGDGIAETRSEFLTGLSSPFGMALVGSDLYVANADAIVKFPYVEGADKITAQGQKIADLPGGPINHHWTKGLVASRDGTKLYAAVGSNSNVAERGMAVEEGRAAIHEINIATGTQRVFAWGLRNPVGMDWNPETGELWAVVNERDELGSDLVPDYMTSVKDGAFYGWPYSYYGQTVDTRVQPPDPQKVSLALKPDYALGNHVAALGLAFSKPGQQLGAFGQGAFVGEHGSWNRKPMSGYKVVFVKFENGKPAGTPQDVLTGFLDGNENALGRPVGLAWDARGGLLVADDVGNAVWRVSASSLAQQ
jgi:glucose/arabinose dehydrogenase